MNQSVTFFCTKCGHHVFVYGNAPEESVKELKICTGCGRENVDSLFARIDSDIPHPRRTENDGTTFIL